ncbi:MAG: hypothetical protein E6Q97_38290 [Desulfurellales bacterium]|nr:MAG: hypothetical protein E6Q97_38290 [Desulfurellales bacterium]
MSEGSGVNRWVEQLVFEIGDSVFYPLPEGGESRAEIVSIFGIDSDISTVRLASGETKEIKLYWLRPVSNRFQNAKNLYNS